MGPLLSQREKSVMAHPKSRQWKKRGGASSKKRRESTSKKKEEKKENDAKALLHYVRKTLPHPAREPIP